MIVKKRSHNMPTVSKNTTKSLINILKSTIAEILTVHLLGYNQGISYGYQDISHSYNFITMKNSALFFHNQRKFAWLTGKGNKEP